MASVSFYINNAEGQHTHYVMLKSAVSELVDVTHMAGTFCKVTQVLRNVTYHTQDRLSSITVDQNDSIEGDQVATVLGRIQSGLTQGTCAVTLTNKHLVILTGQVETAS